MKWIGVGDVPFSLDTVNVTDGSWIVGNVTVSSGTIIVVFSANTRGRYNGPDVTINIVITNPAICLVFIPFHTLFMDNVESLFAILLFNTNVLVVGRGNAGYGVGECFSNCKIVLKRVLAKSVCTSFSLIWEEI